LLETRRLLSFVVTSPADSGAGSLRQAIFDLNNAPSGQAESITFDIGAGIQTIQPQSALPVIKHSVTIDGSPPANYPDQVVVINGSLVPNNNGLVISAGSSTVMNLVINGFTSTISGTEEDGLLLESNGGNLVEGCKLGTDPTGTMAVPNDVGIAMNSSANNTIGGTTATERNIISGNKQLGVAIAESGSVANVVEGNYIGTDISGSNPLANAIGVIVDSVNGQGSNQSGLDNTIGGATAGAGNVISGNELDGIQLYYSTGNEIEGNFIGTTSDGMNPVGNVGPGVDIFESTANTVGGTTQGAGNVISGNQSAGVWMAGTGSTANVVEGNTIGLDATRDKAVGNFFGVQLTVYTDSSNVVHGPPSGNTIGGTTAAARNVISGDNFSGIEFDSGTASNVVEGNWIGIVPTANGSAPLGNGQGPSGGNGITIVDSVANTIGGATSLNSTGAAPGNVISANHGDGILLTGADSGTTIAGNLIGTDSSGIFGTTTGGASFGNTGDGVHINISLGTFMGTMSNLIGGNATGDGNVISNNGGNGVEIDGSGPTYISVQGNFIGTDANGTVNALANIGDGVLINGAANNTIGGTGGNVTNVISGNDANGIWLEGQGATGNVVQANLIGLGSGGATIVSNADDGIFVTGPGNLIGGTNPSLGNTITGNLGNGVDLNGPFASNTRLLANIIGLGPNQKPILSQGQNANNQGNGVLVNQASNNTIGAGNSSLGNVIAGNILDGVLLEGNDATGNLATGNAILGNYIGTSPYNYGNYGNGGDGIGLQQARSNTIGGTAITGQQLGCNVIGANLRFGIYFSGTLTSFNQVLGNFIGTDPSQSYKIGNLDGGVFINDSSVNSIGGTTAGAGNVITNNGAALGLSGFGVTVWTGAEDSIRENSIYANGGRGIDLGNTPVLHVTDYGYSTTGPNDEQNYPYITAVQQIAGFNIIHWGLNSTPNSGFDIDLFWNTMLTESGFGDGQHYLYSAYVTTDANGNATFISIVPLSDTYIAATATDSSGNTSEFSMVDTAADGIADAWKINGIDYYGNGQYLMLPDATPGHKDIYIQVDAMAGLGPQPLPTNAQGAPMEPNIPADLQTGTYLGYVVSAFYNAPVSNPDGIDGINLHIRIVNTNIADNTWIDGNDGFNANDFNAVQAAYFGSAVDPDARAAWALAYRYCVFADAFSENPATTPGGDSGASQVDANTLVGNNFFVSLGPDSGWPATIQQNQSMGVPATVTRGDYQDGAFMHELGHTLGLLHGGGDAVNYKLNYDSVMNYLWTMPAPWMYQNGTTVWKLDYSEQALPPLNELDLNESAGIGGNPSLWVEYPIGSGNVVPQGGQTGVDWNQNGTISGPLVHVQQDINGATDQNGNPVYTTLYGYND